MMNVQQKPFGITYCNMHPGQEDFNGFFTGNDRLILTSLSNLIYDVDRLQSVLLMTPVVKGLIIVFDPQFDMIYILRCPTALLGFPLLGVS